jgi:hypothetical protein
MKKNILKSEGGFSRWSRLKLLDEDKVREEKTFQAQPVNQENQLSSVSDLPTSVGQTDFHSKNSILTEKGFVKPMLPLAEPEDGETAYEAAPKDALEMLDAEAASLEAFPLQEPNEFNTEDSNIELTPEQAEAIRNLPPIETLKKDSDFTPFFKNNVPDYLKRHAFKALWASSPFFNIRDGLDDYDENFRFIDKLITAVNSDYKAGKGYSLKEETEDIEDDLGDGEEEDTIVDEDKLPSEEVKVNASIDQHLDEGQKEVETDAIKASRKSDVRPPDDSV